MKNENQNIDQLFRERLGNYSETPPAAVWESLEKRLDGGQKRRFIGWPWFAALMVLLSVGGIIVGRNLLQPATIASAVPGQTQPASVKPTAAQASSAPSMTDPANSESLNNSSQNNSTNTSSNIPSNISSNNSPSNISSNTRTNNTTNTAGNNPSNSNNAANPGRRNSSRTNNTNNSGAGNHLPGNQANNPVASVDPTANKRNNTASGRHQRHRQNTYAGGSNNGNTNPDKRTNNRQNRNSAPTNTTVNNRNTTPAVTAVPPKTNTTPAAVQPVVPPAAKPTANPVSTTVNPIAGTPPVVAAPAAPPRFSDQDPRGAGGIPINTGNDNAGGGGGGGGGGGSNDDVKPNKKKGNGSWEGSISAGYEKGLQGGHSKGTLGAYFKRDLGNGWAVGAMPTVKVGSATFGTGTSSSSAPQSFYDNSIRTLDTVVHLDSGIVSYSNHAAETFDSVVITPGGNKSTVWSVSLPIVISKAITPSLSIFAGPVISYGNMPQMKDTRNTYSVTRTDSTSGTFFPVGSSFFDSSFTHSQPPLSSYPGSALAAIMNPLRIGYLIGFEYKLKNFLVSMIVEQQLSGYSQIPDEVMRKVFSQPYFRFTLGYTLFSGGGHPKPHADDATEPQYKSQE